MLTIHLMISMNHQAQLAAAAQQFNGETTPSTSYSTSSSTTTTSTGGASNGEEGVGALDGNGARGILPSWMKSVLGQATKQAGSAEMALGEWVHLSIHPPCL